MMLSGSSSKTMLGILKRKGYIDYDKETMWLTAQGKEKVGPELANAPKTNAEIQSKIKERIKMKILIIVHSLIVTDLMVRKFLSQIMLPWIATLFLMKTVCWPH